MDWKPISAAPFDRYLELAVIDGTGTHRLVFPCRRILGGWLKVETRELIDVTLESVARQTLRAEFLSGRIRF